jgi:hypothetical protein
MADVAPARSGGNPGRLLTAVLEREQGEVREPGDVVLRGIDPENAAFVARPVTLVEFDSHSGAPVT